MPRLFEVAFVNIGFKVSGRQGFRASIRSQPDPRAVWHWVWVSAVNSEGRTIWIVDAHGYGKRFIVRAEEKLTAFVELQRAIHEFAVSLSA